MKIVVRAWVGAVSGALAGTVLVLALPRERPALDEGEYVTVVFGYVPFWMVLSACLVFGLLTLVKAGNRWSAVLLGLGLWLAFGVVCALVGVFREDSAWLPLGAFLVPTVALTLAGMITTPRRAVR